MDTPRNVEFGKNKGGTMTKIDVIESIYGKLNLPRKEVGMVVESVFDIIKETLQHEDKLMISGFGDFIIRNKKSRRGRNPQTGVEMEVKARRVLTFKPSPVLKAIVNQSNGKNITSPKPPPL